MEAKINQVNQPDEELSFDETGRYVSATKPIEKAFKIASRAADKYLSFEGVKTTDGLLDLVGVSISIVDNLSQEGRDIVLSETKSFYSRKISEMD